GAAAAGRTLGESALETMGVQVVSLRLSSGRTVRVSDDQRLASGDTLVLSGTPEPLRLAEEKLTTAS
ncbi:MAG TPA: TrkA C-terminal domain-containing protein, partial [Burkholderiaceae bacterium]|nr:TrkA C-terminal domain-containing protein [Burkholderiaceae bacterium]